MKALLLLIILSLTTQNAYPQQTARERIEQKHKVENANKQSNRTLYQEESFNKLNEIIENSRWSRIIYRHIDLTNPTNTPLNSMFPIIFRSLQKNEIKAYEYLDGRELFTDEFIINFNEFIDRFEINKEAENGSIQFEDSDIPTHEVKGYYLKEVYYFDTPTSSLRVLPISICPIISRNDNYDVITRYPLFWIPYSEIEEQARKTTIMLTGLNNSSRGTLDDFFKKRLYKGEIYKTGNPGNLSISQYTNSPEDMKVEQDRIEKELNDFEMKLIQSNSEVSYKNSRVTTNQNQRKNVRILGTSSGGASQTMRDRRY